MFVREEQKIALDPEKFRALTDHLLKNVNLLAVDGSVDAPWKEITEKDVRAVINTTKKHLPLIYQQKYATPLEDNLDSLLIRAQTKRNSQESDKKTRDNFLRTVEVLAGAVYCHDCGAKCSPEVVKALRCFLAVVSNTYRSFIRPNLGDINGSRTLSSKELYPPLATFRNGEVAPSMLTSDAVQKLIGGTVGVVILPAVYKDHPLLWSAIAHEVGGHEMLNAMPLLMTEIQTGVRRLFNIRSIRSGGQKLEDDQYIGLLWQYWTEETVADVCGVLNIGPSYGISLAVYQAALNKAITESMHLTPEGPWLRMWSGVPPQLLSAIDNEVQVPELDRHPTDILKLHVIIGAIENLTWLLPHNREKYVEYLRTLAGICSEGQDTIRITGLVQVGIDVWIRVNKTLPLREMQDAARRVGAYIATAEFQALGGQSLQKVESWDENDEDTAQVIADCLLKGRIANLRGMGDDAQLLAGAMLAFIEKPKDYETLTSAMMGALEFSYANDHHWGVSQFHSLIEIPDPDMIQALGAIAGITSSIQRPVQEIPPPPITEPVRKLVRTARRKKQPSKPQSISNKTTARVRPRVSKSIRPVAERN